MKTIIISFILFCLLLCLINYLIYSRILKMIEENFILQKKNTQELKRDFYDYMSTTRALDKERSLFLHTFKNNKEKETWKNQIK